MRVSVCGRISGVSAKTTRTSSDAARNGGLRAPAPHGRCRGARPARRSRRPAGRARPPPPPLRHRARPRPRSPCRRLRARIEHMREQRAAGDLVQHLRPRRAHAGALAGGEHDRKAGPVNHGARPNQSPRLVISEAAAAEKPGSAAKFSVRHTKMGRILLVFSTSDSRARDAVTAEQLRHGGASVLARIGMPKCRSSACGPYGGWRSGVAAPAVALFVAVIFCYSNADCSDKRRRARLADSAAKLLRRLRPPASNSGAGTAQPRIAVEFGPRPPRPKRRPGGWRRPCVRSLPIAIRRSPASPRSNAISRASPARSSATGSPTRSRSAPARAAAPSQRSDLAAGPPAAQPERRRRPETPAPPVTEAAMAPPPAPASQPSGPGDAAPLAAPDAGNRRGRSPRYGSAQPSRSRRGRPRRRCRRRGQLRRPADALAPTKRSDRHARGPLSAW